MKHKMIDKIIYRAYRSVNDGYGKWLEAMGYGCPELQRDCVAPYTRLAVKVIPIERKPAKKRCTVTIVDYFMPTRAGIMSYPSEPKYGTPEWVEQAVIKRNKIIEQRLKDGTAEYRNGIIYYKGKSA
jgi:hypothetical protein